MASLACSSEPRDGWSDAYFPGNCTVAASKSMLNPLVSALAVAVGAVGAWTDWRSRRIPNWLTVPALGTGIAVNSAVGGWNGAKDSLLGAALGLGLLLPFVLVRSLGAGDWKLVGALGAFLGPRALIGVLMATVLVAGGMALVLIIYKKRVLQTARNLAHIAASMLTFHSPGPAVSIDNPDALKVPFGIAVAIAVAAYSAAQTWGIA